MAGRPLQYFHERLSLKYASRYGLDPVRHFAHYVRGIVTATATPNAVFGFRVETWDLPQLLDRLRDSGEFGSANTPERDVLQSAFPRLRCIQLTREDKLRQAISKARAMQTDHWVIRKEQNAVCDPVFDPDLIAHCLLSAKQSEEKWNEFFKCNEIEPLTITYEDLCTDYPATVARVLDFLRIKPPRSFILGPPQTVRQADALTEEWVDRYKRLHAPTLENWIGRER